MTRATEHPQTPDRALAAAVRSPALAPYLRTELRDTSNADSRDDALALLRVRICAQLAHGQHQVSSP